MDKNWRGLLRIDTIEHVDINGKVIWSEKNLKNILHKDGEEFVLLAAFTGGNNPNTFIPDNYYFGLDNRTDIAADDVMADVLDEPVGGGYSRQTIDSTTGFEHSVLNTVNRVTSDIITFNATGAGWGPIKNLFFTDQDDGSGYLISSVELRNTVTLAAGESINLMLGLSLRDCPS